MAAKAPATPDQCAPVTRALKSIETDLQDAVALSLAKAKEQLAGATAQEWETAVTIELRRTIEQRDEQIRRLEQDFGGLVTKSKIMEVESEQARKSKRDSDKAAAALTAQVESLTKANSELQARLDAPNASPAGGEGKADKEKSYRASSPAKDNAASKEKELGRPLGQVPRTGSRTLGSSKNNLAAAPNGSKVVNLGLDSVSAAAGMKAGGNAKK